jgi:predicted site-specific integrase-resolvase
MGKFQKGKQPGNYDMAPNTIGNERFLDNQDMMEIFHISSRTLQRWRSQGLLQFIVLGKKIYYAESDVYRMLEKHKKMAFA